MKYIYFLFLGLFFFACGAENDQIVETVEDAEVNLDVAIDSMVYFNDLVKSNPNSAELYYQRAFYELGKGDIVSSKKDLEQAIRVDSSHLEAHILYANIQLSLTHLDTSKAHYEFVIDRDSSNTDAYVGMSKLHALLNNSGQADAYISRALEFDPYLAEAYFMRGMIYRSDFYATGRQESWDIAISSFQTTVEQDPEYYSAYVQMGVMHDQIESELALEYYNSALDVEPLSAETWYNVGIYHQTRKEIGEAIDAYKMITDKIDSTWADPYYNQGYIHLVFIGDLDSSIYFLTKATDLDPNYYQAYNNLGLAYESKEDIPNAKKYYRKAIEANPDFQLAKDNLNSLQ